MRLSRSYLLGWFAIGVAAQYGNSSTSTCETLSSVLTDSEVFFPDSDTYNASITSYPFIQLRLEPTCIVRPKTAKDVSTAVGILRDSGTKFAVRGGGHNANAGFNNIVDGVTIDLQTMNAVELDQNSLVVKVAAGSTGQNVYDAIEPYNVSALAPRIGVVGVAGFLTGGGIAFFSPERGWSCDYILNFEVVLATGEIVEVNATSRPDLYTALKGGQNNFGIVTRFDLQGFSQGPLWGGRIFYGPEADSALVQGYTDFKMDTFDPYAAGWVTLGYNWTTKTVTPTSTLWYTKPEEQPGKLAHVVQIGPQARNGMQYGYAGEFTRNASLVVKANPRRTIWAGTTFKISPTILHRIHVYWNETVREVSDKYPNAKPYSELTFQSIPAPPKPDEQPNSLGFDPNSKPQESLISLQVLFFFDDETATDGLYAALEDFIKTFNDMAEEEGLRHKYIYLNYAGWFQDPLGGYGAEVVDGLKQVSLKYDPEGLFQKQLVGGFKLFK